MIWKCEISKNQSVPNLKYSCQVFVIQHSFLVFWHTTKNTHVQEGAMDGLYQRPWLKSWWKWNDKEFFRLQLNLLEPILHSGLIHFAIFFFHILVYRVGFVFLLWLHKVKYKLGTLCNCWIGYFLSKISIQSRYMLYKGCIYGLEAIWDKIIFNVPLLGKYL